LLERFRVWDERQGLVVVGHLPMKEAQDAIIRVPKGRVEPEDAVHHRPCSGASACNPHNFVGRGEGT
jgi:hypothetical protein